MTRHFARLVRAAGLPSIRVYDFLPSRRLWRWLVRSLAVVQEMLGQASVTTTADTYSSVLPEMARSAA